MTNKMVFARQMPAALHRVAGATELLRQIYKTSGEIAILAALYFCAVQGAVEMMPADGDGAICKTVGCVKLTFGSSPRR